MARESAIDQLNADDKAWLDNRFKDKGFCGYAEIADILQSRGYDISKSSVHRYGQEQERVLEAVQASTQAAIQIAQAAPDDADLRSSAVLSMMQTGIFESLQSIQSASAEIDPVKRLQLYASSGKGIGEIIKASLGNKKWQIEVREKAEAAAKAVDKIVKSGGLSAKAAAEIRKQILGIVEQ